MAELPSGTVSLLFTDIEGSTQLQRRLGDEYQGVVESHRLLLEEAIAAHGGDGRRPSDRVVLRRVLAGARCRESRRAGAAGDLGPRVARWRGAQGADGHPRGRAGGRQATATSVSRSRGPRGSARPATEGRCCSRRRPDRCSRTTTGRRCKPLGSYRLKDFSAPEPIYQVVLDGGPAKFPPIRAEGGPTRRRWFLLAVAVLVLVGAIAGALVALSSGGPGAVEVGPTALAVVSTRHEQGRGCDRARLQVASDRGRRGVRVGRSIRTEARSRKSTRALTACARSVSPPAGPSSRSGSPSGTAPSGWQSSTNTRTRACSSSGRTSCDLRRTIPYGGRAQSPIFSRLHGLALGGAAVWAIDPGVNGVWRVDPRKAQARRWPRCSLAGRRSRRSLGRRVLQRHEDRCRDRHPCRADADRPGDFTETASIALGASAVWFAAGSGETLFELDPETLATKETFTVGHGPSGISIGEGAVWVANSRDGTISRVDPSSGKPTGSIPVGPAPGGVVAAYGAVWTSPGEPRS